MTRRTSPNGREHVEAGDRVRHVDGRLGTLRLLAASMGVATVQWDDGTRTPVELNVIARIPMEGT